MPSRLEGIRGCVFDAYGTLFDVASACRRHRGTLGEKAAPLAARWRDKQLQYTWLRAAQGRHAPFDVVTSDALSFALRELDIAHEGLAAILLEEYLRLELFADARDALHEIRAAGLRMAILSNGTAAMLAGLLQNAGLDGAFDAVLSVDEVGAYKPDRRVYALAVERLALAPGQICFVSSNAWDAHAASASGMRVAWCNRAAQFPEYLPGVPDVQIRTLLELPAIVVGD